MRVRRVFRSVSAIVLGLVFSLAIVQPAMAANKSWSGGGDGATFADTGNWTGGVAPVNTDTLIFDNSVLTVDAELTNDQSNLSLAELVFTGPDSTSYSLSGNTIGLTSGIQTDQGAGTLSIVNNNITAQGTLQMTASNGAVLGLAGVTNLGNYNVALRSYDDGIIIMAGQVTGSGRIYIYGDGLGVVLNQDASMYRPVTVKDGGVLWGNGTIGSLTVTPTGGIFPEKCMTANNVTIDGYFHLDIGGLKNCTGKKHNRLNAKGKVDLTGATLASRGSLADGYVPTKGDPYVIIANDGTDAVAGVFMNRPHGSQFKIGVYTFKISYRGGSGNDVTLTRL